jgi:hypothetical protein
VEGILLSRQNAKKGKTLECCNYKKIKMKTKQRGILDW